MKIETKFNLDDEVFVLHNDKIHKVIVTGVFAFHEYNGTMTNKTFAINYRVKFEAGGETKFSEDRLFATKLSLINSL